MIKNEYRGKASDGRTRDLVDIECDYCQTVVTRQTRYLRNFNGKHWCSPICMSFIKGTRKIIKCDHCGTDYEVKSSQLSKSKSGKHFCSRKCKDEAQTYMEEIQPEHYNGKSYRLKALKHYGAKCNSCGFDKNEKALQVHHRDRNRENNELENLEVLCANCHAIEHYGGS